MNGLDVLFLLGTYSKVITLIFSVFFLLFSSLSYSSFSVISLSLSSFSSLGVTHRLFTTAITLVVATGARRAVSTTALRRARASALIVTLRVVRALRRARASRLVIAVSRFGRVAGALRRAAASR